MPEHESQPSPEQREDIESKLPASAATKETLVRAIDSRFDPSAREQIAGIVFRSDEGQKVQIEQYDDGARLVGFIHDSPEPRFVAGTKGTIDVEPEGPISMTSYILRPSDEGYDAYKAITLDTSDRDNTTLESEELNEKEAKEVLATIAKLRQLKAYQVGYLDLNKK